MRRDTRIVTGDAFHVTFTVRLELADGRKWDRPEVSQATLPRLVRWVEDCNWNNVVEFSIKKNQ